MHAIVFGMLAAGVAPLAMAGYAMAMPGPVVLVATMLAGAWRWRGGPAMVAVIAAVAVAAWVSGLADGAVLRRYADVVTGSAAKLGPPAALTFLLVGGVLWGARRATWLRGRPAPGWTRPERAARWRRVAALVAAACALPYGLLRMTWLTPWPIGATHAQLVAEPEIRLHGLLLGLAALAGCTLTLGLVSRWGEVWPRWMPAGRGRPVPVRAAVVPSALVAALLTGAAVPVAIESVAGNDPRDARDLPVLAVGPRAGRRGAVLCPCAAGRRHAGP